MNVTVNSKIPFNVKLPDSTSMVKELVNTKMTFLSLLTLMVFQTREIFIGEHKLRN